MAQFINKLSDAPAAREADSDDEALKDIELQSGVGGGDANVLARPTTASEWLSVIRGGATEPDRIRVRAFDPHDEDLAVGHRGGKSRGAFERCGAEMVS